MTIMSILKSTISILTNKFFNYEEYATALGNDKCDYEMWLKKKRENSKRNKGEENRRRRWYKIFYDGKAITTNVVSKHEVLVIVVESVYLKIF